MWNFVVVALFLPQLLKLLLLLFSWCVWVCCVGVRECLFYILFYSPREEYYAHFKLWTQIDEADSANQMSFLPSSLVMQISLNPEALSISCLKHLNLLVSME